MIRQIEIQCKLINNNGKYELILIDKNSIVSKLADMFIIDKGINSILLSGVLRENIEYKTKNQLGYYFGVILPNITDALIEIGYKELNIKLVDAFLREKYLSVSIPNENTGEIIDIVRSLSSLFKEDMMIYIDKCIAFAQQDLKIKIPLPDEFK